jgi:hypothetical protein
MKTMRKLATHGSDPLTSGAAVIGISVGLIGGARWQSADDWQPLLACVVIAARHERIRHRCKVRC